MYIVYFFHLEISVFHGHLCNKQIIVILLQDMKSSC
jgi:hypothetical protein